MSIFNGSTLQYRYLLEGRCNISRLNTGTLQYIDTYQKELCNVSIVITKHCNMDMLLKTTLSHSLPVVLEYAHTNKWRTKRQVRKTKGRDA